MPSWPSASSWNLREPMGDIIEKLHSYPAKGLAV